MQILLCFFLSILHYMRLGKQMNMESLCSMVFCSPDIDKKCLWELYSIFNSLIIIHFLFSYLSFAVLEKNMVTDDSMMMTLGVMKMAHDFSSNEEVRKFFWLRPFFLSIFALHLGKQIIMESLCWEWKIWRTCSFTNGWSMIVGKLEFVDLQDRDNWREFDNCLGQLS